MNFAAIFVFALLEISHQQIQQQGGLVWWSPISPYLLPPTLKNYQHIYQDNAENQFPYNFRPTRPVLFSRDEDLNQGMLEIRYGNNIIDEKDFSDSEARIKSLSINRSPFSQGQELNPRFFYFGTGASTYTNLLFKTATFTITSTLNITSVQTCIPSGLLADNAPACRKRREILYSPSAFSKDTHSYSPSETTRLMSTMLPSYALNQEIPIDSPSINEVSSSKDESTINAVQEPMLKGETFRDKRFIFNNFVVSTTMTSFLFLSTTITKTVNLVKAEDKKSVLCRPANYVNC